VKGSSWNGAGVEVDFAFVCVHSCLVVCEARVYRYSRLMICWVEVFWRARSRFDVSWRWQIRSYVHSCLVVCEARVYRYSRLMICRDLEFARRMGSGLEYRGSC
jgi:hypothetical protein